MQSKTLLALSVVKDDLERELRQLKTERPVAGKAEKLPLLQKAWDEECRKRVQDYVKVANTTLAADKEATIPFYSFNYCGKTRILEELTRMLRLIDLLIARGIQSA